MEFDAINIFGLSIVVIMLVPNIFYGMRLHNTQNKCTSKAMNIIEQVGRYASFVLMFFPLGVYKFGFPNVGAFLVYIIANGALLLAYLVIWVFYFNRQSVKKALALAIIPTCIFLVSGITLHHWLLVISAVIFGVGHIYVTYKNNI